MEKNQTLKDEMLPGFFRCNHNQLYVCHHLPRSATGDAVLICNATGHEYESCHRALRQLAVQLARSGRHAMRFDYSGTGDSAGEYMQASLAQWRQDMADAVEECRHRSGRKRISLVGIRLGATLAAQLVSERDDIDALILYAPVFRGDTLLAEWTNEHAKYIRSLNLTTDSSDANEIIGYPLIDEFRAELRREIGLPEPGASLRRVLILVEDPEEDGVQQISEAFRSHGVQVDIELIDKSAIWRRESMEAIVPFKTLRNIVAWLDKEQ